MASIEEIRVWLASATSPCKIWVEDPEKHKERVGQGMMSMEKVYFSYRIFCKIPGRDLVSVRHRYSEFEALRSTLVERYGPMGILVPNLPPKKSLSSLMNTSDANNPFVKERTFGLSMFCESLLENPFLRSDSAWRAFMRPPSNAVVDETENLGEKMLQATLLHLELPYRATLQQRMTDVKDEASCIDKELSAVIDKVKQVQTLERSLAIAHDNCNLSFRIWSETEARKARGLGGYTFDARQSILTDVEAVSHSTQRAAEMFALQSSAETDMPSYSGLLLLGALEHESVNIDALKDLVKVYHDAIITRIEITQRTPSLSQSVLTSSNVTKEEKAAMVIAECEQKLALFYKGFIHFTLPMFSRRRANLMRRAASNLCAVTFGLHSTIALSGFKVCQDLMVAPDAAVTSANNTLELLGLKQLPVPPMPADLQLPVLQHDQDLQGRVMESVFDTALAASGKLPADTGLIFSPETIQRRPNIPSTNTAVESVSSSLPVVGRAPAVANVAVPAPMSPVNHSEPPVAMAAPTSVSPPPAPTPLSAPSGARSAQSAPVSAPAPAVLKTTQKTLSLLDDLMGESASSSNSRQDLWN